MIVASAGITPAIGADEGTETNVPPPSSTSGQTSGEATLPDLPARPPTLDAPRLPTTPIVSACEHLLESEMRRIALPEKQVPFAEALRIASIGAGCSISGDWASLDAIGIRDSDPVSMPTQAGTVPVVLDQLLGMLADAWDRPRLEATADGLVITSTPGAERLAGAVLHPIGDLLVEETLPAAIPTDAPPASSANFAELVRSMIEPDGWFESGGRLARIQAIEHGLLVTAPPSVQIQVRRLLDQLRIGRPHQLEATISIVEIDAESARRLETSTGPGTVAAVRAVTKAAIGDPLLDTNVVTVVDGDGVDSGCDTAELTARLELRPRWDRERRRLRCRLSIDLTGDSCGGRRTLTVDQEIAVPVGGLVVPLPRSRSQSPLALVMIVRSR